MKKYSVIVIVLAGLCISALHAQAPAPSISAETKNAYNQIKTNLTKAAEKMPEDAYGFQPSKEERNFGGWVAHVADAQMGTCTGMVGERKNINAGSKTSKADLMAALKQSFDACDVVYDALTDANAMDPITGGRAPRPRLGILTGNIAHDNECYGSMAVYMRLKGLVPPSTEAQGQRGR